MRIEEIEKLLDKYYDGATTDEEEKRLKSFFSTEDVPEHLMNDKRMFMQLSGMKEPEIPEDLDSKICSLIDKETAKNEFKEKNKKHIRIVRMRIIGSVAAILCIILSAGIYFSHEGQGVTAQDTCSSPEEAAVQTERALIAFSKALNKGKKGIEKAEETQNDVNEKLMKQLKRINDI